MPKLRTLLDALAGLSRQIREAGEEQRIRRMFPTTEFAHNVRLQGVERMTFGKGVVLDRGCFLTCGTLNEGRGYIRVGDNTEASAGAAPGERSAAIAIVSRVGHPDGPGSARHGRTLCPGRYVPTV